MAEVLYSMYSDPQNILYLTFLKSVLGEVQLAIKAFEGEQVDPLKLLDSLVSLIQSVSSRVLNPLANIDVLREPIDGYISPKPYLGYLFESKAAELHLVPEDENTVRKRCVAFTISLTNELRVRLPNNIEALQYMSVFNVEETLKHNKTWEKLKKLSSLAILLQTWTRLSSNGVPSILGNGMTQTTQWASGVRFGSSGMQLILIHFRNLPWLLWLCCPCHTRMLKSRDYSAR